MKRIQHTFALLAFLTTCLPAMANNVTVDLSSLAPADAKTAPTAPLKPELRNVEMHQDDILVVHCPTKKYPGEKGWIEYHAALSGSGCLISTMNRDPQTESFQATGPGTQKIIVGLKQPGSDKIEKDCLITVKVVQKPVSATNSTSTSSPNVQSFSGTTVFENKTSAVTSTTAKSYSHNGNISQPQNNQAKPTPQNVEQQSNSRVKTY
jgi:hypothetical protein